MCETKTIWFITKLVDICHEILGQCFPETSNGACSVQNDYLVIYRHILVIT